MGIPRNSQTPISFKFRNTDGVIVTGAPVTSILISKDVGSESTSAGSITTQGNTYWFTPAAGDFNATSIGLIFKTSTAGVLDATCEIITDPTTAPSWYSDTSGVTTLLQRIGGNITIGGGKVAATLAAADFSGCIAANVAQINGQAVTATGAVTVQSVVGTAYAVPFTSVSGTNYPMSSLAADVAPIITRGTMQSATGTTIQLAAGSSSTDDYYNGMIIEIWGGGASWVPQSRLITDYSGSSLMATVSPAWTSTPITGNYYRIKIPSVQVGPDGGSQLSATQPYLSVATTAQVASLAPSSTAATIQSALNSLQTSLAPNTTASTVVAALNAMQTSLAPNTTASTVIAAMSSLATSAQVASLAPSSTASTIQASLTALQSSLAPNTTAATVISALESLATNAQVSAVQSAVSALPTITLTVDEHNRLMGIPTTTPTIPTPPTVQQIRQEMDANSTQLSVLTALSPLISNGAFTEAALANTPSGNVTATVDSAAIVAALKASVYDTLSFETIMRVLVAGMVGKTVVDTINHRVTLMARDGTTAVAVIGYNPTVPGYITSSTIST